MQPYEPQELPISELDWNTLVPLLGRANRAVAEFRGLLHGFPSAEILLSPMTTQEAVLSSRIEGTRADLEDVLSFEAGTDIPEESRRQDIQEIINYRQALSHAQTLLDSKPFCLNSLLELHGILMSSVRGFNKARGMFRTTQDWIGRPGSTRENATFVPPVPEGLIIHLGKWESYYHADEPDPLVQLAIIHAQFELLHPFLDGNGRLGRLLVPLFLYEKQILNHPCFYISDYLEAYRDEYYLRLQNLATSGHWTDWVEFFLRAVVAQGEASVAKALAIRALYDSQKTAFLECTNSKYGLRLLDFIFQHPVFRGSMVTSRPDMPSKPTVYGMLDRLREAGILNAVQEKAGTRPQILAMTELINLCEGRADFHDHR